MNEVEKAIQTQLKNIETRSGKSLDELSAMVRRSGLKKHGEIRDMLRTDIARGDREAARLAGLRAAIRAGRRLRAVRAAPHWAG